MTRRIEPMMAEELNNTEPIKLVIMNRVDQIWINKNKQNRYKQSRTKRTKPLKTKESKPRRIDEVSQPKLS
ncbi:unnamed protein product [Gordionus sp. m RMFG-2023]